LIEILDSWKDLPMDYKIPKRTIEELNSIKDKNSISQADVYNQNHSRETSAFTGVTEIENEIQGFQNKKQKLDSGGIELYSPNIENDAAQSSSTVNTLQNTVTDNLLETKKNSIEEQAQLIDYRQKIKAQVNKI
jgi:hypothetical protein